MTADSRRSRVSSTRTLAADSRVLKRSLDLFGGIVGLVVLTPVLAALAALVWLTSRGPVFYRQRRLGLHGRTFDILKFRTMRLDAEPDGVPVWADDEDDRCTQIGGVLRRFGLDELPQLWNVVRGDMSLVGPRPERPEFAREFARRWPRFPERLAVRGGITGLAQVEGFRGNTHIGRRLERDLRYIAGWSILSDVAILVRTIPAIVSRRKPPPDPALSDAYSVARPSDGD